MLFSTYPLETLPKQGDTVCQIYGHPLTVLRRQRDRHGQIHLTLVDPNGQTIKAMVEAVHWWPRPGDIGTGIPAIYQRWLSSYWDDAKANEDHALLKKIEKAFRDYENPSSWLYSDFTVVDISPTNLAAVTGAKFHGTKKLPVEAIAVLRRATLIA